MEEYLQGCVDDEACLIPAEVIIGWWLDAVVEER